ncbi:hypothetical protein D3C72_245690 [compost metagenome]
MMLRKIYNNLPIVLLVLIVLSIPYLMYKGVKISPRVGYIKDCSGVPVPENLEKNKLDSYCDCVKNPNDFRPKEEKIVSCIDEAKPKPSLFDLFKG